MQPELKLRVTSALVMGVVALFALWMGGGAFALLAAAVAVLVHHEWATMTALRSRAPLALGASWAAVALVAVLTVLGLGALGVVVIAVGAVATGALALPAGSRRIAGWAALGVVYAGFAGLAAAEIRANTTIGLIAMAYLLAIVWATDIFAYFCGRAIGGPKLAPKISPGKTWSGAIFGMFAGTAAGTAIALLTVERGGLSVPLIAAILSVTSQLGDLFESWMKRKFAVKDSGRLIPGHGGVMDRVDGLVFAAFTAFLIAVLALGRLPTGEAGSSIADALMGL
jgi:phosphatidate cytidylyltransferase